MFDAGISPEQAENVVAACGLVVAALARLGPQAWTTIELATAVEQERRPAALAAARTAARKQGCAAMLDHALHTCRGLVRSADGLQDCPDLDALVAAVDCSVAAALMAGRIAPGIATVLTAPQHALTALLATATTAATAPGSASPTAASSDVATAEVRPGAVPRPRRPASAAAAPLVGH